MVELDNVLTLEFDPATIDYLLQLLATRIYGSSIEAVAIALIDEGVRNAIRDSLINVTSYP